MCIPSHNSALTHTHRRSRGRLLLVVWARVIVVVLARFVLLSASSGTHRSTLYLHGHTHTVRLSPFGNQLEHSLLDLRYRSKHQSHLPSHSPPPLDSHGRPPSLPALCYCYEGFCPCRKLPIRPVPPSQAPTLPSPYHNNRSSSPSHSPLSSRLPPSTPPTPHSQPWTAPLSKDARRPPSSPSS